MKNVCRHVDDSLPAYRDGDLPAPARRRVACHLGSCPECRDRLDGLDRALDALSNCRPAAPPEGMLDAFHARLAEDVLRHRRPQVLPSWPGRMALACAAAALTAVIAWPHAGEQADPTARAAAPCRQAAAAPAVPAPAARARRPAGLGAAAAARCLQAAHSRGRIRACSPRRAPEWRAVAAPAPKSRPAIELPAVAAAPAPLPAGAGLALTVAQAKPAAAAPAPIAAPAPPAAVQIVGQRSEFVDPFTGETREVTTTRVVDTRTGKVHITLSCPAPEGMETREINNG